jgi:lysophospholipid acyltransferase (LPLAT)-like uncharacterized protein
MITRKRILKSKPMQFVLAWAASLYLRLVFWTVRWEIVAPASTQRLLAEPGPLIACFWHGRMMMMRAGMPRQYPIHILISEHRDGLLISRALRSLDVHTVSRARRRGGQTALRAMLRLLADGGRIGITPDGPRGPRMRAKAGAIKTAQLSGVPLIPASGAVNRRLLLGSWDRFCLAFPFSRGIILAGEPIDVPREASAVELEKLRKLLEDRLNALTAEADRHFGQPTVEPAAPNTHEKDKKGHARA